MKTNTREILIYYNASSSGDKKTVAHAQTLTKHVKAYTFEKAPSTKSSWSMIMNALNLHPKDILDKSKKYYQEHLRNRDFDDEDWLNVIMRNPDLIKAPIAIRGRKAILCINSTDIHRLIDNQD